MKYFYSKSIAALLIAVIALITVIRLAAPELNSAKNEKEISKLIDTLLDGNVHISSELVDLSDYTVFEYNMLSSIDAESFSKNILGRGISHTEPDLYSSSVGSININGTHIEFTPANAMFAQYTEKLSIANAADIAKEMCVALGISTRDCRMEVSGSKNGFSVSLIRSLRNLPVFNNALVLELNENGLQSVSGVMFKEDSQPLNERTALNMSEALIKFMNECTDKSRETIITDVRLGYMIEAPDSETSALKAVWRIIVENSAVYYIDA